MPGVTHLPRASITSAPAGTATFGPAATMRPLRMTTVPPGIGSPPSPSATVPPVMAMVCAASGAAVREQQRGERRRGSLHVSFARLAELEIADRAAACGLLASYISAPSIHTRSGRV